MEFLIVILLISHFVVLYLLRKDIVAYKRNNQLYIHRELETIQKSFDFGVREIAKTVSGIQISSQASLMVLQESNNKFENDHKKKFKNLTDFIESDYKSLTALLSQNNELLGRLLNETENNILQNEELKPALINSHDELQKVYGKIKQVVTSSEKHLKDVKDEIANSLEEIQINAESKVKQLAAQGEKNIKDSISNNLAAVTDISSSTSAALKIFLAENHISQLSTKVEKLENNLLNNIDDLKSKNRETGVRIEDLMSKLEEGGKKNKWF